MFMDILDQIGAPVSSTLAPRFTERQGQYLAFISTYTLLNRRPPAEADFQRFFQVTLPAVRQMIVELERRGLISRERVNWLSRLYCGIASDRGQRLKDFHERMTRKQQRTVRHV